MTFETDDNVDTGTTENNAAEVETEQTTQDPEQKAETEQPAELSDEEKAQKEAEQEKPKKNRAQERIQQLAREKADMAAELAEYKAKANQPAAKSERPIITDYEDVTEYQKDLDEYLINQAQQRFSETQAKSKADEDARTKQVNFESTLVEIAEEIPDFDKVVTAGLERQLPMPVTLDEVAAEFGYDTKTQVKLLYELAKDEEFHELVSSSPKLKAARLLSERVESWDTKAAPKVSKAPPPITPVKASATASRSPESMSDDEWYQEQTKSRKGK